MQGGDRRTCQVAANKTLREDAGKVTIKPRKQTSIDWGLHLEVTTQAVEGIERQSPPARVLGGRRRPIQIGYGCHLYG